MAVFFPHWHAGRVPRDVSSNLSWRRRIHMVTDRGDRATLRRMCAEDFLFYCAGFLSIFDAGDESGKPGPVPFVPYEFQVELFAALWNCLHVSRESVRVKKPRKLGLTWSVIALFEHAWHFMPERHFLVGSHRESEVDAPSGVNRGGLYVGMWSLLMPKFDFLHIYQPSWLLPAGYAPRREPCRARMQIMNPDNGSMIWGTSAAGVSGHGERGWAALWDEASRTENLYQIIGGLSEFSPCKFWISTIGNLDHPFSTTLKDSPGIVQLAPQWWMHPIYSEGLTVLPDGRKTSPWLERKLDEIGRDPTIANEQYYGDESMQVGGYYGPETFERMKQTVREPLRRGELDIIDTPEGPAVSRFCDQPNGRWLLWTTLDANGRPPRTTRYASGWDIAAGSVDARGRGASNTVGAFADRMTGEIVAEFAVHGMPPYEVAHIAAAAGRWFGGEEYESMIVAERNGPGAEFIASLSRRLGYYNLFSEITPSASEPKIGWHKGPDERTRLAFGLHREMICDGRLQERSEACADEMRHYQYSANGKGPPIHAAALFSRDPSGARDNHGDRVIARVCLCQALRTPYAALPKVSYAPRGSYRAYLEEQNKKRRIEWTETAELV